MKNYLTEPKIKQQFLNYKYRVTRGQSDVAQEGKVMTDDGIEHPGKVEL